MAKSNARRIIFGPALKKQARIEACTGYRVKLKLAAGDGHDQLPDFFLSLAYAGSERARMISSGSGGI